MVNNCNNNNNNNIIINCHHAMIIIRQQQQQQQQRSVATKMMMLMSSSRNKNTMIGYHHRSHYKSIRSVMPYSGHLLISMILFCLFIRTIYTDSGTCIITYIFSPYDKIYCIKVERERDIFSSGLFNFHSIYAHCVLLLFYFYSHDDDLEFFFHVHI